MRMPYIVAAAVSIIFGFSFLFTKGALDYLSPYQLLAYRFLTAALALTVLRVLGVIRIQLKGRPLWKVLALALVQPILYFVCETAGVKLTTSSEAGMMIALIPVVVAVLGAVFLQEKPTLLQWCFIVLSVFGVGFIVLGGQAVSVSGHGLGFIALSGAVLAAAVYNILSRRLSAIFQPVELTYVMMWAGAVFFTILAAAEHGAVGSFGILLAPLAEPMVLAAVLYLGLLSSVAAFFCLNYVLSQIEASRSAVFANLTTVVSMIAGVAFRGEPFFWYHWIGGFLILLGVWGTNYFAGSRTRRSPVLKLV